MRGFSGQFGARVWLCCAMVGAGGLGGLIGGYMFDANRISAQEAVANIKVSAAEAVSFRFPNQWHDGEAEAETTEAAAAPVEPAAPPARYAVASVGSVPISFGPKPLAEAVVAKATEEVPETQLPPWAMATPVPLPTPRPKMALASATTPEKHAAVAPKKQSNAVLNSTQIASIKRRLNLTPDQERYWPAVEAQLRKMEYKKGPKGDTRTASIDTSKMDVQGLRTAGFPLVMSFNDEQKRELKSLAHLLGLENAMSGF
ncbi:MAG: hypothetical protein AB7S93_03740 [Xanthobacteraceae bacterium]